LTPIATSLEAAPNVGVGGKLQDELLEEENMVMAAGAAPTDGGSSLTTAATTGGAAMAELFFDPFDSL